MFLMFVFSVVNPNMLLKSKETAITVRKAHKTCTISIQLLRQHKKIKILGSIGPKRGKQWENEQ